MVRIVAGKGTLLSVCAAVIIFPLRLPVRDYSEPHTSMTCFMMVTHDFFSNPLFIIYVLNERKNSSNHNIPQKEENHVHRRTNI